MVPCSRASLPVLLLLGALAVPATAAVPSVEHSTLPTCFVACPLGDAHLEVIVRDFAGNPIFGSAVVIDFSGCPGALVCASEPIDPYEYNPTTRTVRMFSDATGRVVFPLRTGGGCGAGGVRIFADGVMMKSYALVSPDQSGDGMVLCFGAENDCALLASKVGGLDPTGDFDCDGDVDQNDANNTIAPHHLHACDGVVSARRGNWGRVKAFYR